MAWLKLNKRIATSVAIFFTALTSMTHAQTLSLPQTATDPVVLHSLAEVPGPEMLSVYVAGATTPLAGRYTLDDQTLSFLPAFGFEPGQNYVAHVAQGDEARETAFSFPEPISATEPAKVTDIFPSGDVLPENTLRFYLHFSVPMQSQVAFDYIHLVDARGKSDKAAFMRFKQELWNADRTRLTVLIDPGRIKRDVATNLELGPALLSGQRYSLVVKDGWPAADGNSVLAGFEKAFRVVDPLRIRPDTNQWTLIPPCAGTMVPLTIALDRPFDRHLLPQSLRIETGDGLAVEGFAEVTSQERAVTFTPYAPWPAGNLLLVADPILEDVAGNNFLDLLDHVAGAADGNASAMRRVFSISRCVDAYSGKSGE